MNEASFPAHLMQLIVNISWRSSSHFTQGGSRELVVRMRSVEQWVTSVFTLIRLYFQPSIFCSPSVLLRVMGVWEPVSSVIGWKVGYTLDRLPVCTGLNEKRTHLQETWSDNQPHMHCFGPWEEKVMKTWGEHTNFTQRGSSHDSKWQILCCEAFLI